MGVLVVGASGATGTLVVKRLLDGGELVKIVVRPNSKLPDAITSHENLTLIREDLLELGDSEISQIVDGCNGIVSCLGHSLSFRGIFGPPYRLVTETVRRLCKAARETNAEFPVKIVLMNTTGNSNRDIPERVSLAEKCVIALLRVLIPPHRDNELAADYLRTKVGSNDSQIEWVVVRPDTLTNEDEVTDYETHPSPVRSAIFDAGTTSRINVSHFMVKLLTDQNAWTTWKGKMPVIYNAA